MPRFQRAKPVSALGTAGSNAIANVVAGSSHLSSNPANRTSSQSSPRHAAPQGSR
jgi:hypothetical protein